MTNTPPDQLLIHDPPVQGLKRCWTCSEETPYSQGFCAKCWSEIPDDIRAIYAAGILAGAPWTGFINSAVVDGLAAKRRAAAPRRPPPPPKPTLRLSDLDLDL